MSQCKKSTGKSNCHTVRNYPSIKGRSTKNDLIMKDRRYKTFSTLLPPFCFLWCFKLLFFSFLFYCYFYFTVWEYLTYNWISEIFFSSILFLVCCFYYFFLTDGRNIVGREDWFFFSGHKLTDGQQKNWETSVNEKILTKNMQNCLVS